MKNRMLAILITAGVMVAFTSNMLFAQAKPVEKKAVPKVTTTVKKEMKKDAAACEKAGDKAVCKEAMVCPVSGKPANKDIFTVYKGQKVYFCCNDCKAAFEKDPAKYEAKIHKQEGKESGKKLEKPAQK